MLLGEFNHNLDSKNRIFIPAKMREYLGDSFVIAKSLREKCLTVYSLAAWDEIMTSIKKQDARLRDQLYRFLNPTATEVVPDAQGRVVLPKALIDYAEIERELIILGCYNHAEIWLGDNLEAYRNKQENLPESLLAEVDSLGIL